MIKYVSNITKDTRSDVKVQSSMFNRMFSVFEYSSSSVFPNLLELEGHLITKQGSILGPILCAIYVSPFFDIADIYNYAGDNLSLSSNNDIKVAQAQLIEKLETITKWLTDSRLKVNDGKTELCKFHQTYSSQVEIMLNNIIVKPHNSINILGLIFIQNSAGPLM